MQAGAKLYLLFWKRAGSVDEIRSADACQRVDGLSYVGFDVSHFATLVHNLAMAGGLCAAHGLGYEHGDRDAGVGEGYALPPSWFPGCGRSSAP